MRYRRDYACGGCYFFTVVTAHRRPLFEGADAVALLRDAFRRVRASYPFHIDAMVVLPDHLHCIWTLPEAAADFSLRWQLIKRYFSTRTTVMAPCWQKRFWEHRIRDEQDYANHVDYIHYNPVRHGYVSRAGDWPYSSFERFARRGMYDRNWGGVRTRITRDGWTGVGPFRRSRS